LEEMDEVFGDSKGLAFADQERQDAIHRRLGLFTDDVSPTDEKKPSTSQERDSKEE
jgi:hypothetical protein